MSKGTEDREMDFFDWADLEDRIIEYSRFLIENDAYTISNNSETSETIDSINIEENSAGLNNIPSSPPTKDVPTTDTKIFYIRLSDFLDENEKLLGTEAVAF